jgi:hypothetical protein
MSILDQLAAQWMAAKVTEKQAVEFRRTAEDAILFELKLNSAEGVSTHKAGPFEIKITNRVSHKVDSKKVQEIAAENDLQEHLSTLFRWKPDLNMKIWKDAAKNITDPFSDGITTTPGRASFSITEDK